MTTAELIVKGRKAQKLSRGDLAKALSVTREAVRQWESALGLPTKHFRPLIEALKLDPNSLAKAMARDTYDRLRPPNQAAA